MDFKNELSFKIALKRLLASILIILVLYQSIIATQAEMEQFLELIYRIEGECMQYSQKLKRQEIPVPSLATLI